MTAIEDAIQTPAMTRRLHEALEGLISANPNACWRSDLSTSNRFPFQYYVTAMSEPGPDADQVLVIAVECFDFHDETGERLIVSADITGEDGLLLSESPRAVVNVPAERIVLRNPEEALTTIIEQIQRATDGIAEWIASQNPIVRQALAPEAKRGIYER